MSRARGQHARHVHEGVARRPHRPPVGASGSPRLWLRSDSYGFTWGTALVAVALRRVASFRRDRRDPGDALVLAASIEAPADGPAGWHSPKRLHSLEVYVSPTGRSVRVFLDGEELRRG